MSQLLKQPHQGKSAESQEREVGNDEPQRAHACDVLRPNAVETARGESGWEADMEKVCISVLAAAQLALTCLISQVFKSSGLPSQAHSSPISLIKVRLTLPV